MCSSLLSSKADPQQPLEATFVEAVLLLTGQEMAALETAAQLRSLTMGAMLRCLVHNFLFRREDTKTVSCSLPDGGKQPDSPSGLNPNGARHRPQEV